MKVAILAGGLGSRLTEETSSKSKAMVRIGDQPILWHIARYYACFGLREFVIAAVSSALRPTSATRPSC
jgi:glucose-1-phosphate cytidylyltransferase